MHLGLPNGLFPSDIPIKVLYAFLISPRYEVVLSSRYLILLGLLLLLKNLFWNTRNLFSSRRETPHIMKQQVYKGLIEKQFIKDIL